MLYSMAMSTMLDNLRAAPAAAYSATAQIADMRAALTAACKPYEKLMGAVSLDAATVLEAAQSSIAASKLDGAAVAAVCRYYSMNDMNYEGRIRCVHTSCVMFHYFIITNFGPMFSNFMTLTQLMVLLALPCVAQQYDRARESWIQHIWEAHTRQCCDSGRGTVERAHQSNVRAQPGGGSCTQSQCSQQRNILGCSSCIRRCAATCVGGGGWRGIKVRSC